jgi:hypothetical protein
MLEFSPFASRAAPLLAIFEGWVAVAPHRRVRRTLLFFGTAGAVPFQMFCLATLAPDSRERLSLRDS